ncbi:MAG: hypothetical protein IPK94_12515 [Saprospiraceae bacterium]|nr:hypothetical protein [Saprospiraceae bacterium]
MPANNKKIGAQKWVIHLVKNNAGVVVSRSVGLVAREPPPSEMSALKKKIPYMIKGHYDHYQPS